MLYSGGEVSFIQEPSTPLQLQAFSALSLDSSFNKETYAVIDRNTGKILETKEYKLNENRAQNTSGLKRTMKNIRDLINNNFTGANNELFLTLTYRQTDGKPMTDVNKASSDFEHFIKSFHRKLPDIEYIAVLEPQESGAWH